MKKINEVWHQAHPLGAGADRNARIAWHAEHAVECGCRPVPESLKREVESYKKAHR